VVIVVVVVVVVVVLVVVVSSSSSSSSSCSSSHFDHLPSGSKCIPHYNKCGVMDNDGNGRVVPPH